MKLRKELDNVSTLCQLSINYLYFKKSCESYHTIAAIVGKNKTFSNRILMGSVFFLFFFAKGEERNKGTSFLNIYFKGVK